MNITRTNNPLHFTDLEPHRFEQLAYDLLTSLFEFKRIDPIGIKGNDGGVDIYGEFKDGTKFFVQCKRYSTISKCEIKNIVDCIQSKQIINRDDTLIYFFACDISAHVTEYAYNYAKSKGFSKVILFTSTKIEEELYNHPNILNKYFSIDFRKSTEEKIQEIKQDIKIRTQFKKLFLRTLSNTNETLLAEAKDPSIKFNRGEFIIRSIWDDNYEDPEKAISPTWYPKNYLYDALDDGIEFLNIMPISNDVIIDKKNKSWHFKTEGEILDNNAIRLNKKDIREVALVPYHEIELIEEDGDLLFSEPILLCKFEYNGTPFKRVYYKDIKHNINFIENSLVDDLWKTSTPLRM